MEEEVRLNNVFRASGEESKAGLRTLQNCFYADERQQSERRSTEPSSLVQAQPRVHLPSTPDSRLEDRLKVVESQLAEVLANQGQMSRSVSSHLPDSPVRSSNRFHVQQEAPSHIDNSLPAWNIVVSAAKTYLQYCDCQPLPLFHCGTFMQTLQDRDPEVLFSILALALRFRDNESLASNVSGHFEAARSRVSKRLSDGNVELSTIQTLCLLTLVDFADGKTGRASFDCSLAMSLAHNAGLTSEPHHDLPDREKEERRRCFWSLFLLKRLHGADFMILDFSAEDNFPWYPETTGNSLNSIQRSNPESSEYPDKGIVAHAIQLSEVWFKITRYARRRGKPNAQPPWSSTSDYSTILAHQMDFETRMPYIHRFEPAKFSQKTVEQLEANRDYWGPWLFVQFLYHTNLCLLNHPLLLSLRLRGFKCVIPEIFLQHTADLVSSHTSWIINFIDMLEAKPFKVTDPFLGHCVAIVSTIYLQESFVNDPGTREEKQAFFEKCLRFIRGFGPQWPHLDRIAEKLQKLAETVSSTYVASEEHIRQNRKLLIDLGQFFEVLEYSLSSEMPGSAASLFGTTLQTSFPGSRTEMAQTSVLPAPTRVERQDFSNATPTPTMSNAQLTPMNANLAGMPPSGDILLAYSDDELAVLAESFFHQRQELDGNVNWWNSQF
ncbi:related to C6 transcription factor [Phialocephala subalpina]|uniref:Related to C6 transcription factor n=1 Tax=Phialocephala subalpina TaxID=576137 RepID=A0A1L7WF12_9HELO|nr:related to C6 transcription factor [Phialocephala subalpina]